MTVSTYVFTLKCFDAALSATEMASRL